MDDEQAEAIIDLIAEVGNDLIIPELLATARETYLQKMLSDTSEQ